MAASDYVTSGQAFVPINALTSGFTSPTQGFLNIPDFSIINFGLWGASDESLKAVAIAPDSDVDTLLIRYPDAAVPQGPLPQFNGGFSQYIAGVGSPLVGQINAVPFPKPSNFQMDGRIIFTTNRAFFGTDATNFYMGDPLIFGGFVPPPQLKAIGYLADPPFAPVTRTNYTSSAFHMNVGPGDAIVARRPFYGRAVCDLELFNVSGGGPITAKVYGVDLNLTGPSIGLYSLLATVVLPDPAPGPTDFLPVNVNVQNRYFDAIEIRMGVGLIGCAINFVDAK
jgi:hypothetical protein